LRKNISNKFYDNLTGYVFISPWLIGFIAFMLVPLIVSLYYSFTEYDMLSPAKWVGIKNYINILSDDDTFWSSLKTTFFYTFVAIPFRLIFALLLAVLFSQKRKFLGVYRATYYLPSIIGGSVAVALIWRQLFSSRGALNSFLSLLLGIDYGKSWIGSPDTAIWTIILLAAWQFGSPMLIFVAGLKQIPINLYEAAIIDGSNWWHKFFKITLPMLSPVIFFNLVVQLINGFMMFTEAFIVTGGGPFNKTLVYVLYVFRRCFTYYEMGYGCALSWILLIMVGIVTLIIFKSSKYWVYYESRSDF
jgi:multiple sugar transport system permease protein